LQSGAQILRFSHLFYNQGWGQEAGLEAELSFGNFSPEGSWR
jgi:hypothetical protein